MDFAIAVSGEEVGDHSTTARQFGAILVIDENGRLRYDSRNLSPKPIDLSNRDYFRRQQTASAPVLYVGQPESARQTGAFIVGVSKRLTRPDGTFAGVVTGTVMLNHFKKLFNDMALGPHSIITLGRTDGLRRDRRQAVEDQKKDQAGQHHEQ